MTLYAPLVPSDPVVPPTRLTACLAVCGFVATSFGDLLDRGFPMPAALIGAAGIGSIITLISWVFVGQAESGDRIGGPRPPRRV